MSERIDHAAEAVNFLGAVSFDTYGDDDRKVALAQVHATLALVEQQRIANLVTLWRDDSTFSVPAFKALGALPTTGNGRAELYPHIKEALGIE